MIRVAIVDDESLIRSGFQLMLETADDIEVVWTADGVDASAMLSASRPDVLLLDIRMPVVSGLQVLEIARALETPPVVAILTTFDTDEYVARAMRLGASGFLVKDTDPDLLPGIVRSLAAGGVVLSPQVSRHFIDGYLGRSLPASAAQIAALSPRERQVLQLLAQGRSNTEIAAVLFVSAGTVKDHVSSILTKLKVATRLQAALIADRAGIMLRGPGA